MAGEQPRAEESRPCIELACAAEAGVVGEVLGEAFADDPVLCHTTGRRGAVVPLFASQFRHNFADLGCSFLVRDASGNALASALWAKPGQKPGGLLDMAKMSVDMVRAFGARVPFRFVALANLFEREHPQEPHYYLHALGVRCSEQGRGLGTLLLRHVLDQADAEGALAYLENSNARNMPLYLRHGFEVVGQEATPGGGPPVWFMLRPPRLV